MNVINCPECSRANIDTASLCLRCGYKFGEPLKSNQPVYNAADPFTPQRHTQVSARFDRQKSKKSMPEIIELGLMGIKSREAALMWFYGSIVVSVLVGIATAFTVTSILQESLVYGLFFGVITAAFFSLSSLWYWSCIAWMDANDGWADRK